LSISHRLTKRHTRPLKTWNNFFFVECHCVSLSSRVDFFLSFYPVPPFLFLFFKLEISTERKKRGFVRTWPTRSLLSLFLDRVTTWKKNKCVCVCVSGQRRHWTPKVKAQKRENSSMTFFNFVFCFPYCFFVLFLFLDFLWFDIGRLYITNEVGELDRGLDRITIVKNQMLVGFAFYTE
jgi:hypothetical protein